MIDTTKEYIACAAIHYDNHIHYPFMNVYGVETGFVLCGFRHPMITVILPTNIYCKNLDEKSNEFTVAWSEGKRDFDGNPMPKATQNSTTKQGFMTSLGRFVSRDEAAKIALECGQIEKLNYSDVDLYSEDIFPLQAIKGEL